MFNLPRLHTAAIRALSTAMVVVGLLSACKPPIQVSIEVSSARPAMAASLAEQTPAILAAATVQPVVPTRSPHSGKPRAASLAVQDLTVPPATTPPVRIVARSIELDAPIVEIGWVSSEDASGVRWQTADDAAGFHTGTALPGHAGNTVLSGHHNIAGKVFARVVELQPGDEIQLHADGQVYRYQVEDSFILPERGVPDAQQRQNARWIEPTDDERLTLVTCWPANDNSHRVIVIARPVH